jgi:bifunctional non-homologous end joining protein LigD
MAAQPVTELPDGPDWLYEVKWDGFRALVLKDGEEVRVLSRNDKSLADDFAVIAERAAKLSASSVILDGEIVALDENGRPSFQILQQRNGSGVPANIEYYAFDLLHLEGEDLRSSSLEERRRRLKRVLEGSGFRLSPELPGTAAEVVTAVSELALEGVVAKRRTSLYRAGERPDDWRKLRFTHQQEFVIGGYRPGMKPFESVLVGFYEGGRLLYASKVRAGFTPETRREVWKSIQDAETDTCPFADLPNAARKGRWGEGITATEMKKLRWVEPHVVVPIAFLEWTRHGHLRQSVDGGLAAPGASA